MRAFWRTLIAASAGVALSASPPMTNYVMAAGVSCGLGTFGPGNWPSSCWRPYSDSSPFNRVVPDDPPLLPHFQGIVHKILSMGPIADLTVAANSAEDWYHPVYYTQPTDPLYTLHCVVYSCEIEGMQVRIPQQAQPAAGADRHMTIVDQASGWEWDFWQAHDRPSGGGRLVVSAGGRTLITGDGLRSDANSAQWGLLAGIIRAQELIAGRIDHALLMVVGCTRRTYVYPAAGLAAPCQDQTNAPADGQYLQLAMSDAQIDALPVPEWKRTILRALAKYGAFVGDTGGNEAFTFQFESGSTYTSFGFDDPLVAFAREQTAGVSSADGKWYFNLADGVDWARYLRVLDPCVAEGTC